MQDKKTLVLGLGLSGCAAAKFLIQKGISVIGIDRNCSSEEGLASLSFLQKIGVELQSESALVEWDSIQELIVSPGISPHHPIYAQALVRGVVVTGEAELALPHFSQKLVAITGTNGKTTVTLLIEHVLRSAGIRAKALGNVGVALCDYCLCDHPEEVYVVELSSYQLETMRSAVFEAAVLLNITPDHLDRYPSMQEYAKVKCHLQSLVKSPDSFFVQTQCFLDYPQYLKNPRLFGWDHLEGEDLASLLPITYKHKGRHDLENAVAAFAICRSLGVSSELFMKGWETFKKPSHRIEWVRELGGVSYYDDSKGTNIDAVIQAVRSMSSSVVLIVGGVDKGASYFPWKEAFSHKVKQIVAIGQAAEKIQKELNPYFTVTCVDSLEMAVQLAARVAEKGDCVLLSPGCSSFDQFRDYVHRGEEFQKYVRNLEGVVYTEIDSKMSPQGAHF